ncbi:histidine kinase [Chryseobacterium sp. Chry.R1]|uniref:tetratricopeptide repeat-containing sensor histidine kinase n=1 Tax=Chryseobacterium sp. Chry.R1 TaxID=3139392 RepID=UPI0031F9987F
MKLLFKIILLITLAIGSSSFAQDSMKVSKVLKSASKIRKAVDNNDNKTVADTYVGMANDYYGQGNYAKSEEYLIKARNLYQNLNDKKNLEFVTRKLAQSQEKQNKISPAILNYSRAADISYSKENKSINTNDVTRLSSPSKEERAEAIQSNIDISRKDNEKADLAASYSQLADVNIQQNDIPKAEANLKSAYTISKKQTEPQQALEINQKLTNFYVENKDFDKAIEAKKKVLKEDFVKDNSQKKVEQIQELADIYIKKNDTKSAIETLKNAYNIALEKGHTLEAQKSVKRLDSLYSVSENTGESVKLYRDFLGRLPDLVSKDRSLVDNKILEDTEQRIAQLEKERELKDELIRKKNAFNYSLIGALVVLAGLAGFILWTLKKVQIKNKKIALQSLRREMNPHFIFNSLNSVNQFIATNNELEANQYLTKFSKLMRGVMENSAEDFIPFQQELDLLQNYLALEKTRFADKFDYEIKVDESLNLQSLLIPGMLIQPFLENAIWHGLRYRQNKGFLQLNFEKQGQYMIITVDDNGIGIEESKKLKTEHQKSRQGRGMKNTMERITLLNDLYKQDIHCAITDKKNEQGVTVQIRYKL